MNTAQKTAIIEEVSPLRFARDFQGQETASPEHLEDGSEEGFLSGICGSGVTREDAVEDLFLRMKEATRLVKNAYKPGRSHYLWHEASRRFLETSGPPR